MSKTVPAAFAQFKSNLEITDLQESTVSARHTKIRTDIANHLTVLSDFLTGSYVRSTMIAPLSKADIDIFMVLDAKYWTADGQSAALDLIKQALADAKYTSPRISKNGQAVTITYHDFLVDVVPAFNRKGGGFLIPDAPARKWISTDPKRHVAISSSANAAQNRELVPLVKMLKSWNRHKGGALRSFHLECLCWRVFQGVTISNYYSGARYFFDHARGWLTVPVTDPAGYGGDVGAYLGGADNRQKVVTLLTSAYNQAINAELLGIAGYNQAAIERWRDLFGDHFPAYS